ncbi:hypothetical protein ACGF13_34740 [Kitasatospora sp. NPDC048286]
MDLRGVLGEGGVAYEDFVTGLVDESVHDTAEQDLLADLATSA